jgi:valyl-tRNA synthetase
MPLDKTYDPAATEAKLYERWEKSGAFACDVTSAKAPYCVMMPPPNVTGSLHMGHALTFTLQDILIRYQRMKGKDALWQPGTDHAGIATQMVVERQLAEQKQNRREIGREAFLKKVWEWKAESGGAITKQLRHLGASCDWSRERFTMDEELNRAVNKVFAQLYREGLIYKAERLVNWDPKLLTAVSDLEVEQKEVKGNLWHFKYPIENSGEFIIVATTRPETMLGDAAVAVHPENERLKHLIGKTVALPLVGRHIPIIGDDYADPEKGTGAVKITPAHDFNDFEVGKRHKLPMRNIFDRHAKLNHEAPEAYRGLDRFEARKRIVAAMEEQGLLDKIEPHTHTVPHGDRSGVPIEPWLSEQWYCDAKTLAEPALKAVEDGRTQFVPEQWANTYYAWMRNIESWCISRQLWWGHQIPVWYGPYTNDEGKLAYEVGNGGKNRFFAAEDESNAIAQARKVYEKPIVVLSSRSDLTNADVLQEMQDDNKTVFIWRDEDVLDTWFSSALWPFSTLGWPDQTPELKRYYPTDVLVTGFDIIFFWVARMMMMGLHFMKDVPFRKIYIHALVRDEKGQKMSKSKGNVLDPLDAIATYGCDALRFTLASMSTPGRDIKLAASRIEGNRNFATKLWNAARFCEMNECKWVEGFDPASVTHTVNKWIVGETKLAADKIAALLDDYRFDLASSAAYDFVWNNFCDWYLEFTKPIFLNPVADEATKAEIRATTAWVLGQMLHILHPFMPYITEELWAQFFVGKSMLIKAPWPELPESLVKKDAQGEIDWLIRFISHVRSTRSEFNIPLASQIELHIKMDKEKSDKTGRVWYDFYRLAGISNIIPFIDEFLNRNKGSYVQTVFDEMIIYIPLSNVIDLEQERARLAKEGEKWVAEIRKIDSKLGNKDFVDRAPPEVVEEHRTRKAEAEAMLARLQAAQKSLAG